MADVGDQLVAPAPAAQRRPLFRVRFAWPWAVVAASAVGFLVLTWVVHRFVADDAWISLRYAQNIADGDGPVWNPGGERVEGFSNPLLVAVEALAYAGGLSGETAARTLGVVAGLGCVVLVYARGRAVVGEPAAAVAAVLTGLYPPLAFWAVGGLETLPATLLLLVGTLELARPSGGSAVRAGALLAALPWLRPEGAIVAVAVAAAAEAPGLFAAPPGRRRAVVRLAWTAGLVVLSQLVLEAVRLGMFGHLLPNSVLYKSGTGDLFSVGTRFLLQAAPVVALAAAGVLLLGRRQLLLAVPPLVYLAGSIGTRNAVNTYSRFLLPTWPEWALLAGVAIAGLGVAAVTVATWRRVVVMAGATMSVVVLGAAIAPGNLRAARHAADSYASCRNDAREEAAVWLRDNTPPATVFSVSDAGIVPAQSGGRTAIDQFFLNEPLLQKVGGTLGARTRARLVLDRRPDVVVLASRSATAFRPLYPTDRRIHADSRMRRDYRLAYVARGDGAGCRYHLFLYEGR